MTSSGPEAYPGTGILNAFVGLNQSTTISTQSVYFADVNGDGLPDLVVNGIVLFNSIGTDGNPSFSPDSSTTPYPIGAGAVQAGLLAAQQAQISAKLNAANPLVDTIHRWVAPFTGTVSIAGSLNLVQNTSPQRTAYKTADGVIASIQLNGTVLYSVPIAPTDYSPKTPTGVSNIAVNKGDIIYFRVQSINDGSYDQVAWPEAIAYQNVAAATDSNNLNPYSYSEQADFTLHGVRTAQIGVPLTGTLQITGNLKKLGPTSDAVTLTLYDTKNGQTSILYQSPPLAASATGAIAINQSVNVQQTTADGQGNFTQGDALELRVGVDSRRMTITQLVWDPANPPTIAYTQAPTLPAGAKLPSMQMVTEADLYANSDRTVPLAPLVVQTQGTYTFNASVTGTTSGSVVVTAKTPGVFSPSRLLDPTGSSNPTSASLTFNANAGDQVFFEFQARDPNVAASISTYSVLPQGGGTNLPRQHSIAPRPPISCRRITAAGRISVITARAPMPRCPFPSPRTT